MPTSAPSTPRRPPATPVTPRPTPRNASASRSCSPASVSTSKKNKEPMNRPLGQLAKNTVAAHTVAMKNYIAYCKSAVPNFENIDSISFEDCMKIEWWTGFAQYLLNTQLSRKTILQYLSGVKEYYRLANPTMFRALFDEKSYTLLRVNVFNLLIAIANPCGISFPKVCFMTMPSGCFIVCIKLSSSLILPYIFSNIRLNLLRPHKQGVSVGTVFIYCCKRRCILR